MSNTPQDVFPNESLNGLESVRVYFRNPDHSFKAYRPRFDTANPHLLWVTHRCPVNPDEYVRRAYPMARLHRLENPVRAEEVR